MICGLDDLRTPGSASVPVGRSVTGSQVFACVDHCSEVAGADPTTIGVAGWVVDTDGRRAHSVGALVPGYPTCTSTWWWWTTVGLTAG